MYLARFSYDVLPVNRQRAIDFILREVESAQNAGLNARLLVPLTRSHGAAALQFSLRDPREGLGEGNLSARQARLLDLGMADEQS